MPHSLSTTRGVNPHRERTLPTHHWPTLCRGDGMRVTTERYPPTPQLPCWRGASSTGSLACCCDGSRRSSYKPGPKTRGSPRKNGTERRRRWYPVSGSGCSSTGIPQGVAVGCLTEIAIALRGKHLRPNPAGVILHPHRRLGRDGLRAVRTDLGTVLSVGPPRSTGVLSLSEAADGEVLGRSTTNRLRSSLNTAALLAGAPDDAGEGPRDGPMVVT